MNITFSKLFNEDKTRIFRLKIDWEEDYFKLFVLEENKAWFALVTKQHLEKLAEQHELNFFAYMESLREYICNTLSSITVGITPKNAEFVIYRHIEKEKIKVKYFIVKLEKLDYHSYVTELIDTLTSKCEDTSTLLLTMEKQKLQVEEEKIFLEHKCKEFAEMKIKSDNQIYSAVALILNEKKNRIQYLTELLNEYQGGVKPSMKLVTHTNQSEHDKVKVSIDTKTVQAKPSTSKHNDIYDSESNHSDGYNTDDDKHLKSEQADGDLDFLGDESPPTSLVPKRFKSDTSISLPSQLAVDNQASTSNCTKSEVEASKNNETEDQSPQQSQHFDTQDWLDMM